MRFGCLRNILLVNMQELRLIDKALERATSMRNISRIVHKKRNRRISYDNNLICRDDTDTAFLYSYNSIPLTN